SRPPPSSTLFPYTTLFRSQVSLQAAVAAILVAVLGGVEHRHAASACCGRERGDMGHGGFDRRHAGREGVHEIGLHIVDQQSRTVDRKSTRLNSSHVKISYA